MGRVLPFYMTEQSSPGNLTRWALGLGAGAGALM